MPVSAATSAPLDLGTLLTNLGVLVLAIAATVSGAFTGWRSFKKSLQGDSKPVNSVTEQYRMVSGAIIETQSIKAFTESNLEVVEGQRKLCMRLEELVEELREQRQSTRALNEENHRLRVTVADAYELLRRMKPL